MTAPLPYARVAGGVQLKVRLVPRAAHCRLIGVVENGAGGSAVKLAVTAAPVRGAANEAMLTFLADALRLPKTAFAIAAGATERRKLVQISGDAARIEAALRPWLG